MFCQSLFATIQQPFSPFSIKVNFNLCAKFKFISINLSSIIRMKKDILKNDLTSFKCRNKLLYRNYFSDKHM